MIVGSLGKHSNAWRDEAHARRDDAIAYHTAPARQLAASALTLRARVLDGYLSHADETDNIWGENDADEQSAFDKWSIARERVAVFSDET